MRCRYTVTIAIMSFALLRVGCERRERPAMTEHAQPNPSTSLEHASRLGQDVPEQTVWPPSGDARSNSDEIITKVMRVGTGTRTPQLNDNHVLGTAYAVYDKRGMVRKHVPLMVQAIDLAPPTWRAVLLQMKKGEIRRAWIKMPDGETTIMDFEIRSFNVIHGDGTATEVPNE